MAGKNARYYKHFLNSIIFFHLINFSNSFPAQQKTYDLRYLLKLAAKIQKRIKSEHDADIKRTLKNDLKIVKAQIGNQVLDMPEDKKIFPPVKITHYSATNSPVQKIPVKRVSNSSQSVILDLAAKFESFLQQRKKQQNENVINYKSNKKVQKSIKRKSKKKKF